MLALGVVQTTAKKPVWVFQSDLPYINWAIGPWSRCHL